jgi:hypothetical protein
VGGEAGILPFFYAFVGGQIVDGHRSARNPVPLSTPESTAMSLELKRRGFVMTGPVSCYNILQTAGLVNDHLVSCYRHAECAALAAALTGSPASCVLNFAINVPCGRAQLRVSVGFGEAGEGRNDFRPAAVDAQALLKPVGVGSRSKALLHQVQVLNNVQQQAPFAFRQHVSLGPRPGPGKPARVAVEFLVYLDGCWGYHKIEALANE